MTFQVPNLRLILWAVTTAALLAVIALAPTPVSLSGVAMARTPAPTNPAGPTPPPTAVASFSNDATLHKVHIGGDGFSIINPGPGEEASGNIAFDKDNEATVELDSYLTSSSVCAWPTQPQASVAIDREDSLPGTTFDQSLHSSKGCASPVDFDVQTGSNDVTITVTAPDSVTIIRYLITIVVPERPAAPAPETWAQDPVTREHTFITPYTNEALATGFTSANGSADRFWIASIRVEEELARLARVVVSIYDRETGEVDRGAGFNIGPCNGVPSTFKICEYGSFANPELWYGNGILWLTVEKHDTGHGNRHYLYAFQRTGSSWKLLSDKTIRLTHYDHISAGRDHPSGGIWSDGETMWVTGHHLRVYAYNMATGMRDRSEEFSVPGTTGKPPFLPYSVGSPAGLWSNGKTMWVEGAKRRIVYAFDLQTKARVPSRDFDIVRAPPPPSPYDLLKMITSGMWSDGSIIWVRQGLFNVAYDLPGTPPRFAALYAVEMESDSSEVPNLITVVAADADNDSITYAKAGDWPARFGIDSTSGVISYTRGIGASVAPGEYELTVTADDGIDGTAETTVVVSVSGNSGICDRTPQVRYGILALLRNVGDCELVTSSDLAGITGDLLLSDAGIAVLHDGDFSGLTSLQGLNLGHNDLTSLPEDVFDGLTSLEELFLEANNLSELPADVFDGLTSLQWLYLDSNNLSELPADVFDGLTSLQWVHLGHNDLTSLPDGFFEGLSDLDWLRLEGNPGAPFTLTAELEEQGDGALVVKVAEGSPFDLTVELSARGGTLSSTTVVVEAGSLASEPVGVKTAGGGAGRVTVSVVSAAFTEAREYAGIDTGLGQPLVLDVPENQRGQRGDGGTVPAETVGLTAPASVPQDTEAAVTMTFGGLAFDSDTSDVDYIFRADVRNADGCEGGGMGNDRYMYQVDEDPEIRGGSISASCAPGDYTIEVSISSPDNVELASATAGFTVNAPGPQQPEPLSTDATLSGLTLSDVTLAFASATTEYAASVANEVTQTTVTPTTNDDGATYAVKLDGVTDADGVIPLVVGGNAIAIVVTAEDGNATRTYTVTVNRAAPPSSGPAGAIALSSDSVDEGTEITVTMSFANLGSDSDTSDTDYIFRADVRNADGCEGGGMGNDRYMYKVDEDPEVRTGAISADCPAGAYTVEVSISSPDNVELASATAGFMVNAPDQQQPEPASADATLSALTLSDVTLEFASDTTRYTASVASDVRQTTVSPTTNDGGATYAIKLGGVADADGVIPLAVGTNVITVEVTAEDGNAVKTYKVTVTRAALTVSGPAVAIALSPSGPVEEGTEITVTMSFANLKSDSDTSTTDYVFRADVRNADGCEGGGMGNDRYMYKVDEDPEVREGSISASCAPGDYTVEVSISSPDNVELASATAGFAVNAPDQQQPEPASTDATLSGLTLSDVSLAFASDTTRYTASVANDVTQTRVTPTTNDGGASYVIKLDGVADADGVIPLAAGANVITIEVTAEDGNTVRTYTVTVTRAAPPSTDATLSNLALSGVDIGAFDPATTEYAASVANDVDETTVTPTVNDDGAAYAVKLDGVADADGVIPLDVGGNVITIEVTAEDGNTAKTYTVTVTRAALPPAVAPDSPGAPTGSLDGAGNASLDWNDVGTATGYEVGLWWNGEWTTLPNDGAGLGVSISGSGATVTGLPTHWTVYYFRVRAVNEAGTSDWSPMSKLEL